MQCEKQNPISSITTLLDFKFEKAGKQFSSELFSLFKAMWRGCNTKSKSFVSSIPTVRMCSRPDVSGGEWMGMCQVTSNRAAQVN